MIFEVTRDYAIIIPLMISSLISFFISQRLQPQAIYEALSQQYGIHLNGRVHPLQLWLSVWLFCGNFSQLGPSGDSAT